MLYCFLNFFFLHICFFGWAVSLLWRAGAAVFSVTCKLSCSMWDLVPGPGIGLRPPVLGAQHLGH